MIRIISYGTYRTEKRTVCVRYGDASGDAVTVTVAYAYSSSVVAILQLRYLLLGQKPNIGLFKCPNLLKSQAQL